MPALATLQDEAPTTPARKVMMGGLFQASSPLQLEPAEPWVAVADKDSAMGQVS